ncbi:GntR family transcriptional regulator [Vitreimonas sp.]|jgi:DNA-binding GntR family transcriptional regulator|uniref:GntR family transcriptional regulator n=1 Tax=Vitreimonas sp. TaxID=3069702 RepID=UPI002EDA982E
MPKPQSKPKLVALRTPDARVSALGIARATARDIERGVYLPGARLREQELADRFKCSRAPVREALRLLESQGSIVIEPMKGARVATPDDANFYEVFLIRRALAGLMAQQVANAPKSKNKSHFIVLTAELPKRAEAAVDGHEFAGDVRQVIRALIDAAQTPRTVQLVRSLTFGHEAFQDDIVDSKKNRLAQAQYWSQMGLAAASGKPEAARAAMEAIFDYSRAYIENRRTPNLAKAPSKAKKARK